MDITNEIKLKVFAQYLYQKVLFDGKIKGFLHGITNKSIFDLIVLEDIDNNTPIYKEWNSLDTKLILKPLSQISDEDLDEVNKLNIHIELMSKTKEIQRQFQKNNLPLIIIANTKVYQMLQYKGYDLPNWLLTDSRGIWRTLKECGLAIYE